VPALCALAECPRAAATSEQGRETFANPRTRGPGYARAVDPELLAFAEDSAAFIRIGPYEERIITNRAVVTFTPGETTSRQPPSGTTVFSSSKRLRKRISGRIETVPGEFSLTRGFRVERPGSG
jgi:hypothetical protein